MDSVDVGIPGCDFSGGTWSQSVRVFSSHPSIVVVSSGDPSARILSNARKSSRFSGSVSTSGRPKRCSVSSVMRERFHTCVGRSRKHVKRSSCKHSVKGSRPSAGISTVVDRAGLLFCKFQGSVADLQIILGCDSILGVDSSFHDEQCLTNVASLSLLLVSFWTRRLFRCLIGFIVLCSYSNNEKEWLLS